MGGTYPLLCIWNQNTKAAKLVTEVNEIFLLFHSSFSPSCNKGKPVFYFLLIVFIFWALRSFFGTAVVELYTVHALRNAKEECEGEEMLSIEFHPRICNSITAMPKKLPSAQQIKSKAVTRTTMR